MANNQETSTIKQLKNQRRTSTSTEESESVKNVDSGVGVRTLTFIKKEEAEEVEPTDGSNNTSSSLSQSPLVAVFYCCFGHQSVSHLALSLTRMQFPLSSGFLSLSLSLFAAPPSPSTASIAYSPPTTVNLLTFFWFNKHNII